MKTANIKFNTPPTPDTFTDTVSAAASVDNSISYADDSEEAPTIRPIPVSIKNSNERYNAGLRPPKKQSFLDSSTKSPATCKTSKSVRKSCVDRLKTAPKGSFVVVVNASAECSGESVRHVQRAVTHKLVLVPVKASKFKSFIGNKGIYQGTPKKFSRNKFFVSSFQAKLKKNTPQKLTANDTLGDIISYWTLKEELEEKYSKLISQLAVEEAAEVRIVAKQVLKGAVSSGQLEKISEIREKYEVSRSLIQQQRILEFKELIAKYKCEVSGKGAL
eukprot:TRINITY_DN7384_c0_g8_i2.p1 TRINITY_DN7384_c0_g8~~TRINITY_DN7384_c0_g8_i2.p1  ORF type:complete len:275 (+),score=77.17 TRINITY_DN7384_c0_g8_i2:203-1027(+)